MMNSEYNSSEIDSLDKLALLLSHDQKSLKSVMSVVQEWIENALKQRNRYYLFCEYLKKFNQEPFLSSRQYYITLMAFSKVLTICQLKYPSSDVQCECVLMNMLKKLSSETASGFGISLKHLENIENVILKLICLHVFPLNMTDEFINEIEHIRKLTIKVMSFLSIECIAH